VLPLPLLYGKRNLLLVGWWWWLAGVGVAGDDADSRRRFGEVNLPYVVRPTGPQRAAPCSCHRSQQGGAHSSAQVPLSSARAAAGAPLSFATLPKAPAAMNNASLRNAVKRKTHKERGQPCAPAARTRRQLPRWCNGARPRRRPPADERAAGACTGASAAAMASWRSTRTTSCVPRTSTARRTPSRRAGWACKRAPSPPPSSLCALLTRLHARARAGAAQQSGVAQPRRVLLCHAESAHQGRRAPGAVRCASCRRAGRRHEACALAGLCVRL
jgi:hypothetical protein